MRGHSSRMDSSRNLTSYNEETNALLTEIVEGKKKLLQNIPLIV